MRIGIEAQRIFRKNKHGMDYVVLQEIRELQKIDTRNEYFVFVAPGDDRCLEDTQNVHILEIGGDFYPLWEQVTLLKAANELNLDMLHCTSNTAPIRCKIPLILTLHDIIFLEPRDKANKSFYQNMGWFYRRLVVPRILKKCKRIITVSNFEKNNIMSKLDLPQGKIAMIYNGYNEWFKPLDDTEQIYKKYIDTSGYFFFLGNTDPKKNTERTLVAYSKYLEKSEVKRRLLMADLDKSFLSSIIERNHIENILPQIVMPGYIVNKDLPYIYNNAFAFLYTSLRESFGIPLLEAMACGTPVITSSLRESFGIPLLEAMACGTPVITSNTSSMPEIGGPEAILINPEDPNEIAEKMLQLEKDEALYQRQKKIGPIRAKCFSWQQTAEHLLDLYESIYKRNASRK